MVVASDAGDEAVDPKVIPPEQVSAKGASPGDKRRISQLLCHDLAEWGQRFLEPDQGQCQID